MARNRLAPVAAFSFRKSFDRHSLTRIVRLCLVTLSPVLVHAQTTASSEQEDAEDEVVRLSPFQVVETEDVGYRATNTTSGTSLNTAIKDLPVTT